MTLYSLLLYHKMIEDILFIYTFLRYWYISCIFKTVHISSPSAFKYGIALAASDNHLFVIEDALWGLGCTHTIIYTCIMYIHFKLSTEANICSCWLPEFSWWHYYMEMHFALLALCEGIPLATSRFPWQRVSNSGIFSLFLIWMI